MTTMSTLLSKIPSFLTGGMGPPPVSKKPPGVLKSANNSPTPIPMEVDLIMDTEVMEEDPRLLFLPVVGYTLPGQLPEDDGKLTVVLDLDETLIHSKLPRSNEYRQEEDRPVGETGEEYPDYFEANVFSETFRVHRRPGLDQFLAEASKRYELVCFTAGIEAYAKVLMDEIDPENKYFRHRLYRNHCVEVGGSFVKDLSVLNRPMERCVLVDNNAFSFLFQLGNGIPVSSFYDNAQDRALDTLLAFLGNLQEHCDVREHLKQVFSLEALLGESARVAIETHFRQEKS
ncbi:hypothetical protein BASA81_011088 [Batrachochytrium salamandrivorans]|nr:hypothetical protein BASA81_011088 [Batrachochytrium salamandrivorans]